MKVRISQHQITNLQILESPIMTVKEIFMEDPQGKTFKDVLEDDRLSFDVVFDFFNAPDRQQRMLDSELHHDRPPLAGVVRELEQIPELDEFFRGYDSHTTRRVRQAIGALTRMIMETGHGWAKMGKKGSLGTRVKVKAGTTTPGAYYNTGGMSRWFTRAERYEPPTDHPMRTLWEGWQAGPG
jgi:hypothetical protein